MQLLNIVNRQSRSNKSVAFIKKKLILDQYHFRLHFYSKFNKKVVIILLIMQEKSRIN